MCKTATTYTELAKERGHGHERSQCLPSVFVSFGTPPDPNEPWASGSKRICEFYEVSPGYPGCCCRTFHGPFVCGGEQRFQTRGLPGQEIVIQPIGPRPMANHGKRHRKIRTRVNREVEIHLGIGEISNRVDGGNERAVSFCLAEVRHQMDV